MKLSSLVFILLFSVSSYSQVLNVESLRKVTDTVGWSGSVALDFTLSRSVNDLFIISNNIHVQYKLKKHLFLFKNQLRFVKIEGDNFSNNGISHFRYNYKWKPKITLEGFVQGQYNKVSKIDLRMLAGIGSRFKLSSHEKYKFYLGTLAMYEYEELSDGTNTSRDIRGSSYFSFSLYPTSNISFVSTTYYQPLFSQLSDYRIASESVLGIKIYKKFTFKITYLFTYDTDPAIDIQNSQYRLVTGILYSFD